MLRAFGVQGSEAWGFCFGLWVYVLVEGFRAEDLRSSCGVCCFLTEGSLP